PPAGYLPPTGPPHRGVRTTRLCRTLKPHTSVAARASIASHRAFVTMANAPHPPRDGRSYGTDLPDTLSGIFLQTGLDRIQVICPSCQLVAVARRDCACVRSKSVRSPQGGQSEACPPSGDTLDDRWWARRYRAFAYPTNYGVRRDDELQCLKWRTPVNTMAMPWSSAALMTSSSRIEPPGWITAVAPASMQASMPSANGKNASEATTEPLVRGSASFASAAASCALRAAMRAESTRLIWPAPMPTVARSLA